MARFQVFLRVLHAAIFEDWLLKFICLALATMMWIYIDGELTGEVDVSWMLHRDDLSLPPNLELQSEQTLPKYTLRVRAPRSRLQLITADNIAIKKKQLENAQAGSHNKINLQPSDFEGEGFDVVGITPRDEKQEIELTEIASRPVNVRVRPHGQPREGFVIGKALSDPPKVTIEGALQDVDRVKEVVTEEVDVSDADQELVREVGIEKTTEIGGRRISFHCPQKVRVTIPILSVDAKIAMTLDIRSFAPQGIAMQVEPKSLDVEIVGDGNELASPELKSNILLYVEWPATADRPKDAATVSGPYTVPVRCNAPPRIKVQGVNGAPLPTVTLRAALSPALSK
jgi:hypothetical protein